MRLVDVPLEGLEEVEFIAVVVVLVAAAAEVLRRRIASEGTSLRGGT